MMKNGAERREPRPDTLPKRSEEMTDTIETRISRDVDPAMFRDQKEFWNDIVYIYSGDFDDSDNKKRFVKFSKEIRNKFMRLGRDTTREKIKGMNDEEKASEYAEGLCVLSDHFGRVIGNEQNGYEDFVEYQVEEAKETDKNKKELFMRTCKALFPDTSGPENEEDIKNMLGELRKVEGLSIETKTIIGASRRTTSKELLISQLDHVMQEIGGANRLAGNFTDNEYEEFGLEDNEKLSVLKKSEAIYKLQLIKDKLHQEEYGIGTSKEEAEQIDEIKEELRKVNNKTGLLTKKGLKVAKERTIRSRGEAKISEKKEKHLLIPDVFEDNELNKLYYRLSGQSEIERNIRIRQIAKEKSIAPEIILSEVRRFAKEQIRNREKGELRHFHSTSLKNFCMIVEIGRLLSRSKLKKERQDISIPGWSARDNVMMTRDKRDSDGKLTKPGFNKNMSVGASGSGVMLVLKDSIMERDDYDAIDEYPTISDLPLNEFCEVVLVDKPEDYKKVKKILSDNNLDIPISMKSDWQRKD